MNPGFLKDLAVQLVDGRLTVEAFVQQISPEATADLGEAQIDLDRRARCGFAEVIYAEGKTIPTLVKIVASLLESFCTRKPGRQRLARNGILTRGCL